MIVVKFPKVRSTQFELVTNCHRLKLLATDGKMRETDVATAETMLRTDKIIYQAKKRLKNLIKTDMFACV